MTRSRRSAFLLACTLTVLAAHDVALGTDRKADTPAELGSVRWGRDLEEGFRQAHKTNRPLLLLFQEIPGCATCVRFGQGPLSHRLLVDAIENEFVPVVIYNNKPGRDAAVLQRYGEPAWNNPVLRFFSANGEEILERKDGILGTPAVATRLVEALHAAGRSVPPYLELVVLETATSQIERATLGMHCFWQGEAALGGLQGVVATRAAWLGGGEVVEVLYDPATLPYAELVQRAVALGSAARIYTHTDAQWRLAHEHHPDRVQRVNEKARSAKQTDQKWHLRKSHLRHLPLTRAQATRINSDLAHGHENPERWLSPRQLRIARALRDKVDAGETTLADLEPPTKLEDWPTYETALLDRLGLTHLFR